MTGEPVLYRCRRSNRPGNSQAKRTVPALQHTALHDLHVELGAKMVPFAGYDMPVQYKLGVMKEHQHTREKAGLFDVSHMGQVILRGPSYDRGDHLFVVVNAACKTADIARMKAALEPAITVTELTDRALLALQGPMAEKVLSKLDPNAAQMRFMDVATLSLNGTEAWVSRSGYTGEDGYEISVPSTQAEALARTLIADENVEPIGLGARDALRLEAGLCLYGHDIDATTSPVEAALTWAIQKVRRQGGARAGGYPGAAKIDAHLSDGVTRKRVGLLPEGRAPMREGVEIFATETSTDPIGTITSGGFGPTFGGPVAMGYVALDHATTGTTLYGELRGKRQPLTVAKLPFVTANFKR